MNKTGSGVAPVLLYGILPFGIKIAYQCVNDHKDLFTVRIGHFRNFLHPVQCWLIEFQVRVSCQVIQRNL